MKNQVFVLDAEVYLKIVELAKQNGKQPGDRMDEEMLEVIKQGQDNIEYVGETEQDKDLILGNMREEGLKILDLDEIERRKNL